jgi:hypothetical protein
MKKTELVEIIRTLVKEEVNNTLPQLLMEVLAEKITNNSSAILETNKHVQPVKQPVTPRRSPSVSFEGGVKQAPIQAPRIFSSNPILNQVLNETVGGIPNENSVSAPSALDTIQNLPREVLAENKDVAAVANAMTRDYSKLMKAIDAKAKSSRPA